MEFIMITNGRRWFSFWMIIMYFFILSSLFIEFSCSDLTVMNPRFRTHVRTKQEVIMGDRLKLRCAAVGKPRPYVHWYRNNELISPSSNKQRVKLSGTSLIINRVEPGDEGNYACKVWNQIGQIWRNFTVIIIDLVPYYQNLNDRNQMAKATDRKELEKWLGEPLDNKNKDYSDEDNEYEQKFETTNHLDNVPMSDGMSDNFRPNFTLPKELWGNDEITYERAPYWAKPESEMLQTVAFPAGRQVKMMCRANGKPEPLIIWYKDGVEIKAESERVVGYKYSIKKWALVMDDVVPSDKGVYTCRAFNKYGTISHNYTLDVVERFAARPIIAPEYPKNLTVFVGENATFECPVLSDLQPHIEWVRHCLINGSYEDEDGMPCLEKVISDVRDIPDGMSEEFLPNPMVLTLNNITIGDEGWYTCIAGNQLGLSHRSAWLTVVQRSNDSILIERITDGANQGYDIHYVAIFVSMAGLILITIVVIAVCVYQRYNQKKFQHRNSMDEDSFNSHYGPMKKIVQIYRNDSSLSESTLVPKITVTPRYQSGMNSDLSVHYDYEIPLDPEWEIDRDDLNLLASIGEGAFGQVYRGELKTPRIPNGHLTVAVKMLKQTATDRELIDLVSEMEVMKQIGQHPNIINLVGCCTQNGPLYVIVEFCANGNLLNFLRDQRPQSNGDNYEEPNSKRMSRKVLTTHDLVQFAHQVARGMKYLTDKKCIHRDLAARNVLVTEDYILKIGDFGLARDVTEFDYYRKTSDGRLPVKWMAPEALFDRKYTVKSDVWSYGVLLWEIMTLGGKPYPSVPLENLYQLLKQGHRMNQPHNCPNELYFVMMECWQDSPEKRWSFSEIEKYLDDILMSTASEDYLDVVADDLPPAQDPSDGPLQSFDSQSLKDDINQDESSEADDILPSSSTDPLIKPITVASAALLYLRKQSPMASPIRTTLRPISEMSELSDYRFRMDIDDDDDRSRPSATDSGNPSSPGGSFEGSSDSVDSKDSLSANLQRTPDARLKRHSDPLDNTTDIRICNWLVPKNRIKITPNNATSTADPTINYAQLLVGSRESVV